MRRSAVLCLGLFLLVSTVGCQEPQPKEDVQKPEAQTATMQPDYYASDPAAQVSTGSYGGDSYTAQPAYSASPAGGQTHVVAKGDTLYGLARKYYNDQRRWKDIQQANSDRISDPNVIFVGQELVIP